MALKALAAILFILLLPALATAQTRKPVIGISSDCKKGKLTVNETYTKAVLRAGGIPLILPQVADSLT
ncbi:MAG: hypothetical protein LUC23_04240, partial [Prevotellaceae bacterium]|nr:hypothetical protein [Prevotellaceae bacterium]